MRSVLLSVLALGLAGCLGAPEEVESARAPVTTPPGAVVNVTQDPWVVTLPAGGWAIIHLRIAADQWEDDGDWASFSLSFEALDGGKVHAVWWLGLDGTTLRPVSLFAIPADRWGIGFGTTAEPSNMEIVYVLALAPDAPVTRVAFAANNDEPTKGEIHETMPLAIGRGAVISSYWPALGFESSNVEIEDDRPRVATPTGDVVLKGTFRAALAHATAFPSIHATEVYIGNTNVAEWEFRHAIDGEETSDSGLGIWPIGPAMYASGAGSGTTFDAELVLHSTVSLDPLDNLFALSLPWDPAEAGWDFEPEFFARGNPGERLFHG